MTIKKINRIALMIGMAFVAIATTHAGAQEAVTEKEVFKGFTNPIIFNLDATYRAGLGVRDSLDWDDLRMDDAILEGLTREHGGRVVFDEISNEYEELCNSWRMLIETRDSNLLVKRIHKELKELKTRVEEELNRTMESEDLNYSTEEEREEVRNAWREISEVWEAEKKIDANIVKYLRGIKTDRVYNNMQMGTQVCGTIQEVKDFIKKRDHYYAEKDKLDKAFAPDNPQEGN